MMAQRFAVRRIPGTAILAITNLIAATLLVNPDRFGEVAALTYVRMLGGDHVWGFWFLAGGLFLTVASFTRRWWLLNVGSVISLFAWTAVAFSLMASAVTGQADLSPIAIALAWWMFAGQIAMLIVPLLAREPSDPLQEDA